MTLDTATLQSIAQHHLMHTFLIWYRKEVEEEQEAHGRSEVWPAQVFSSRFSGIDSSPQQFLKIQILLFGCKARGEGRKQVYHLSKQATLLFPFYLKPRHLMGIWHHNRTHLKRTGFLGQDDIGGCPDHLLIAPSLVAQWLQFPNGMNCLGRVFLLLLQFCDLLQHSRVPVILGLGEKGKPTCAGLRRPQTWCANPSSSGVWLEER